MVETTSSSNIGGAVNRRTLVKGAAWAVPTVSVGAAAPAMATSPDIVFSHITTWRWYSNSAPWCSGNRDGLEINTSEQGGGVAFTNTRSWTEITGVFAYFWFRRNNISWSSATGNSGCWTVPTHDSTSTVINGRSYYRYRSDYTCEITPTHVGTTVLAPYRWRSQCFDEGNFDYMRWARRQAFATVNGQQQVTDTGAFEID